MDRSIFEKHNAIFEKIGLNYEERESGYFCRFSIAKAKAFMLLHIFLHELGHHLDRISTYNMRASRRGEPFADRYADQTCERIWGDYCRVFGAP